LPEKLWTEVCITSYVLSKFVAQSVHCTVLIYGGRMKCKTISETLRYRVFSNFSSGT